MPTLHTGTVTSIGKMSKTVTVVVERMVKVPKILKAVKRSSKFLVHDEHHSTHLGDKVTIIDGITYSPRKSFRLHTIDRTGLDPSSFAQKPKEWTILENKEKNKLVNVQAKLERRDTKIKEKATFAATYAARVRASGMGGKASDGQGSSVSGVVGGGAASGAEKREVQAQRQAQSSKSTTQDKISLRALKKEIKAKQAERRERIKNGEFRPKSD